ncbi:MAG: peroxiredoxin [Marivirga sp.]|jgi:peroxiredoxin
MKKVTLITLFSIGMLAFTTAPIGYQVGDTATDFSLKGVSGKMVSMSSYEGAKGYIVVFTCNSCPYSVAYEDRIIALHDKYGTKGFPVIAINPNDDEKSPKDSYLLMKVRATEKDFPFAYVYDATQEVTKSYGATNTPHVYVLDKNKEVRYIGAIDNNTRDGAAADKKYVEDAVDALLLGDQVSNTKTKAIGCTIKWAAK